MIKQAADLDNAVLAPLVEQGWDRRGRTVYLKGDDVIVVVNLQRSKYDAAHFINVGVWLLGIERIETPSYASCHLGFRFESLFDGTRDLVRSATAADRDADLVEELRQLVIDKEPMLRELLSSSRLRNLLDNDVSRRGLVRKEAREYLRNLFDTGDAPSR